MENSELSFLPWIEIFYRPRATMRKILDTNPELYVYILAALTGISRALDRASSRSLGDTMPIPVIIIISIVGGAFGGIIGLYIIAGIVKWTGRWIGGNAPYRHIVSAIAWGGTPVVLSLLLWIPYLMIAGEEMFTSYTPYLDSDPTASLMVTLIFFIEFIIMVWAVVVYLKCLGEAQGFSAWKAWGNYILAVLVIGMPVFLVTLIFHGLGV